MGISKDIFEGKFIIFARLPPPYSPRLPIEVASPFWVPYSVTPSLSAQSSELTDWPFSIFFDHLLFFMALLCHQNP